MNDYILAKEVPEIELILGGHDHIVEITRINDTYVIKSGTDFRQLGVLQLNFPTAAEIIEIKNESHPKINAKDLLHGKFTLQIEILDVTKKYEPCPELQEHIDETLKDFSKLMDRVIFLPLRQLRTNWVFIEKQKRMLAISTKILTRDSRKLGLRKRMQ